MGNRDQKLEVRRQKLDGRWRFMAMFIGKKVYILMCFLFIIMVSGVVFSQDDIKGTEQGEEVVSYEENFEKAESLFEQLKAWQAKKDWDDFFSNKDEYRQRINSLLESVKPDSLLKAKALYLDFKVKKFFNEKGRKQVFAEFVEELEKENKPQEQTLAFIKSVISDLDAESNPQMKRKISSIYIRLLKESPSESLLKKKAAAFYKNNDIENFIALTEASLALIEDEEELIEEELEVVRMSSCNGFKDKCAPYFVEDIFVQLERQGVPLSENLTYLRGYNLEQSFEYEKAARVYNDFLNEFSDSALSDEVEFRIGLINMYKLENFDKAEESFQNLTGIFSADEQLDILKDELDIEDLSYNEKLFLESLLGKNEMPGKSRVQIDSKPARVVTGEKCTIKSVSFSPDTGCLVPKGLYLWSGDLGEVKITTNTASLETSFKKPGLRVVNLVEKIPEGVLGYDSTFVNVYQIKVSPRKDSDDLDKTVNFNLDISPYLPEELTSVNWQVYDENGNLVIDSDDFEFLHRFQESGKYSLNCKVGFLDTDIYSQESYFTIRQ